MKAASPLFHVEPYQWHKSAPQALREFGSECDPSEAWSAWTGHLRGRTDPGPIWSCFDDDGVLFWGGDLSGLAPEMKAILARAEQGRPLTDIDPPPQRELDAWLTAESSGTMSAEHRTASALVWSYLIASVADVVSPEAWWELLGRLIRIVGEAAGLSVEEQPVAHQLLAGEAALAVAFAFPELSAARELGPLAARMISQGLEELHDGQGLPHAGYFGVHRTLFASWTRSLLLARRTKRAKITCGAKTQYEWAVRSVFRTARSDDTDVFSTDAGDEWPRSLMDAALELGGNEEDEAIAAHPPHRKPKRKFFDLTPDDPSAYSEWAAVALMRSDWSREAARLSVLFPDHSVRTELESDMRVLWSGRWDFEVRRNGVLLPPTSDWVEVCWDSDDDVDYLELEIDLGADVRMQRAFFLGKEDCVVFLADTILDDSGKRSTFEYRGWLPTTDRTFFETAEESNEGYLRHDKRAALVLPLALSEWKGDGTRPGTLEETPKGLSFSRKNGGTSLVAPLFFDLDAKRMKKPFTWRHLTVAEALRIQSDDEALAWRVRVGNDQWLIYRSLSKSGNRTVLGHNLSSEFLIGRFDESGEVEALVEIG